MFRINKNLIIYATEYGLVFQVRNSRNLLINYNNILRARYIRKGRNIDADSLISGITMLMLTFSFYYMAAQLQIPVSGGLFFVSISFLIVGILIIIASVIGSKTKHRLVLYVARSKNPIIIDGDPSQIAALFSIIKNKIATINSQYASSSTVSQPLPQTKVQTTVTESYEELEVRPFTGDDQTVVKS